MDGDWVMLRSLGFSKPDDKTPILFLDVPGEDCKTPLLSWTNERQNEAAVQIAQEIQAHHLPGKLTTLCYYSSTLRDLSARDPSLSCYTVDS